MEALNTISHDKIYSELDNVLKFSSFKSSTTLSKFIKYIVTETLEGRRQYIKEYTIAVNVLNKSVDFNSNDDAVVRIHAGRLRRILLDYYHTEGKENLVVIHVPKGCYVPEFTYKNKETPREANIDNTNPIVAVFPFKLMTQKPNLEILPEILCEEICAELSLFEEIAVIGHFSPDIIAKIDENILEAAQLAGADFIITGLIKCVAKKLQIRISLLNSNTGRYIMTRSFEDDNVKNIAKIQNNIVHAIACLIGGYYGIIFKEIIKTSSSRKSNNIILWNAIFNYYRYQCSFSKENYTSAFNSVNEAVKLHPDHAGLWAMLGELYINSIAHGIDNDQMQIEEAYRCVIKSLKADPNCQHAWHTLTWINCFKKDYDGCLETAHQCIKINPNASGMVCGVGCILIFAGHYEKGFLIMNNAIEANPSYPWWIHIGYCCYYINKQDFNKAFYWAYKLESEENIWDPLLKEACLSLLDEEEKAKKYLAKLLEIQPNTNEIQHMLSNFIICKNSVSQILFSMEKIGFEIAV